MTTDMDHLGDRLDDRLESRLKDLLEAVDVRPARVDVDRALQDGRRAEKEARAWTAIGATLAVALAVAVGYVGVGHLAARSRPVADPVVAPTAPSSTAADPVAASCGLDRLPVPAGVFSAWAYAIDPGGRYIGGMATSAGSDEQTPVLWTGRVPRVLPLHGATAQILGVNVNGVAVGLYEGYSDASELTVFRYADGRITMLTVSGDWNVYQNPFIDSAGDIAIAAEPLGVSGGAHSTVLYWPAGATRDVRLPVPDGVNVLGMSADGRMVGTKKSDDEFGLPLASYVFRADGHLTALTGPAGMAFEPSGIEGDYVVGADALRPPAPSTTVIRWNLRTGTMDTSPLLGVPMAINGSGQVPESNGVMAGRTPVPLVGPPGGYTTMPYAISDTAVVVGIGHGLKDAPIIPLTWQC
jgi:hypothetical protein